MNRKKRRMYSSAPLWFLISSSHNLLGTTTNAYIDGNLGKKENPLKNYAANVSCNIKCHNVNLPSGLIQ